MRYLALPLAALCLAGPAQAAIQLDQEFVTVVQPGFAPVIQRVGQIPPPANRPNDPPSYQSAVQTFTAGLSGTLTSLEFQAASYGPAASNGLFALTLIDGDFLAGANTVIFQNAVPFQFMPPIGTAAQGVTGLVFDVSAAGYQVTAGQRFSVLFDGIPFAPNQFGGLIIGNGTAPGPTPPVFSGPGYGGGVFQGYVNGNSPGPSLVYDVGFRSYVDVAAVAVPEPATWAMLILGFGAMGGAMRRRRRQGTLAPA